MGLASAPQTAPHCCHCNWPHTTTQHHTQHTAHYHIQHKLATVYSYPLVRLCPSSNHLFLPTYSFSASCSTHSSSSALLFRRPRPFGTAWAAEESEESMAFPPGERPLRGEPPPPPPSPPPPCCSNWRREGTRAPVAPSPRAPLEPPPPPPCMKPPCRALGERYPGGVWASAGRSPSRDLRRKGLPRAFSIGDRKVKVQCTFAMCTRLSND